MCALQLIAPKVGCHQFLFIVRRTPALPTPTEQSGLVPNPTHGWGRGSAVPALGLALRKSGRFHLFSREEWSGHHVKVPTTLAHWDARTHQPAPGEATQGDHSPRAAGRGFGPSSHAQPPLDSHLSGPPDRGQRGHAAGPRGIAHRRGSRQLRLWGRLVPGDRRSPHTRVPACERTRPCVCLWEHFHLQGSPRSSVRWHVQWLHGVSSWGHTRWPRAGRRLPHCPHCTCRLMSALVHKSVHRYVTPSFGWTLDM